MAKYCYIIGLFFFLFGANNLKAQKVESFEFARTLGSCKGNFSYSIIQLKDGKRVPINSSNPAINYNGIEKKGLLIKFYNFNISNKKQSKYRIEFVVPSKPAGMVLKKGPSKNYLTGTKEEIIYEFEVMENAGNAILSIQYEIIEDKKNSVIGSKGITQRYAIVGLDEEKPALAQQSEPAPNAAQNNQPPTYNQVPPTTPQYIPTQPQQEATQAVVAAKPKEVNLEDSLITQARSQESLELYKSYIETYPEGKYI